MQHLHLRPEQDECRQLRRVSEGAGLQVHACFLPHGLAVRRQRRGCVAREEELIVPAPFPGVVLLQKIVSVEGLILRVSVDVRRHDWPWLVCVRQLELEHRFEERSVCRVLHHALGFQAPGRLRRCELLGLAARGGVVCAALEGIRNADDLPRLFVDLCQIGEVLLHVALQIVDVDERLRRSVARPDDLHVVRVHADAGLVRQRDIASGFEQLVDDLGLDTVGGVLLVCNLVDVAVAQEPAVHAHVLLQNDGEDVRLVERDACRLFRDRDDRQAQLVCLCLAGHFFRNDARNDAPVCALNWEVDFLVFLGGLCPLCPAAVRAGLAPAALYRRSGLPLQLVRRFLNGRFRCLRLQNRLRRRPVCARFIHRFCCQRLNGAALDAPAELPRLVVVQVFQLRIVHPAVKADAALVVAVIGDVLRDQIIRRGRVARALDVRLALRLVCHTHAVFPADVLLRLRNFEDDIVHVLHACVDTVLRHDLLRVQRGHSQLSDREVRPLCVVPLDQKRSAALDGHRAFHHVVQLFKRHPVQLVAEHIFDELGLHLVLLPPGRDLRLRNVAVRLRFDQLRADVPDVRCLRFPLAPDDGPQLIDACIQCLPLVHPACLGFISAFVSREPVLPEPELVVVRSFRHDLHSYVVGCLSGSRGSPFLLQHLPLRR